MFLLLSNLREVPHGTKGTGPKFVTRPVYLRSQFRNNANTVLLSSYRYVYYMSSVHGMQVSHITGCSRPPGEVGLTPRQYTEWNVVGRARPTGDLSQQGLLPEVYRTACTERCVHQNDRIPKNPGSCVLAVYIAGDTLRHQPMGSRSHDCSSHMIALQLRGPMGFHVLQWCHPILACTKRTSCCTRIITLYGAWKVDSGPRTLFSRHVFLALPKDD